MIEAQKSRIKEINIVFLVTILISVIVPFLPLDFLWERPVVQIIFSQVLVALPSLVYLLKNGLPYAETVRLKKMKFFDIVLCILFGILIQPAITLINALSMVFSTNTTGVAIFEITEQIPFLGGLLLVAVLPAIMEESVYRGVFYNEYSKIHPLKAALLSGVLFGIMHGNINQFCYAAVMGIIFALLIEATGSILSTMAVHFWTNAGSVVMLYLYPKLYEVVQSFYNMYKEYGNESMASMIENTYGDMSQTSAEWIRQMMSASQSLELTVSEVLMLYGPSALVMGALAFLVYKTLAKRSGNWQRICALFQRKPIKNENEEVTVVLEAEPKQKMVTLPLVLAILIGIAFMVFYEIVVQIG